MNRTRGRLSIARPSGALGPAEIRRTVAPECEELSVDGDSDPGAFSEGLRLGALAAGLIALSCAALAAFALLLGHG